MRGSELLEHMGTIAPRYIEQADKEAVPCRRLRPKMAVAAVCLFLMITALGTALSVRAPQSMMDEWEEVDAQTLFPDRSASMQERRPDSAVTSTSSAALLAKGTMPYETTRDLSSEREAMEARAMIPVLSEYPVFDCRAYYTVDGGFYGVSFSWYMPGEETGARHRLTMNVAPEETWFPGDVLLAVEENGSTMRASSGRRESLLSRDVLPAGGRAFQRERVRIVTMGWADTDKLLTFADDWGWVEITGTHNDSAETLRTLCDWVWDHPMDFDYFT